MLNLNDAIHLRDKLYSALSASSDWAPGYRKNRKYFKVLLESEARLDRELRKYYKELSDRVVDRVNWTKYFAEVSPNMSAAAPKVNVIVNFSQSDIDDEVKIITKIVYKEIAAVAAAGAAVQVVNSKILVANLPVLVDKIARDRAADLATQMTKTTVDKVRSISLAISSFNLSFAISANDFNNNLLAKISGFFVLPLLLPPISCVIEMPIPFRNMP